MASNAKKGPVQNEKDNTTETTNRFEQTLRLRTWCACSGIEDLSVRLAAVKSSGVFAVAISKLTMKSHVRSARRFVRAVSDMLTDIALYDSRFCPS